MMWPPARDLHLPPSCSRSGSCLPRLVTHHAVHFDLKVRNPVMTPDMNNIVMFACVFVLLVCAVLAARRSLTEFSSARVRVELTVSRESLLEQQAKTSSDCSHPATGFSVR